MIEFVGFSKIPRYSRECIITEKIDGTNGCIYIADNFDAITPDSGRIVPFLCGSRSRWISPEDDNHGFAKWAYGNVLELMRLGPGFHFGEWWGQGIQRGYGLKEKRFSLFNLKRWGDPFVRPTCCYVVPEIIRGEFCTTTVHQGLETLRALGSHAAPGFMKPEGIVIYHTAGNLMFKKTLEKDELPKGVKEE